MQDIQQLFPPKGEPITARPTVAKKTQPDIQELFPSRNAPKMRSGRELKEVGAAPELGLFPETGAGRSFMASLGLNTARSDEDAENVLKTQFPEATFEDSEMGRIVKLPSGEYIINKKGFSGQDVARFAMDVVSFLGPGRLAKPAQAALAAGGVEAGLEAVNSLAGGGDLDPRQIAEAAVLEGVFKKGENLIGAGVDLYKAKRAPARELAAQKKAAQNLENRELVQAADDLDVPLFTSDVFEPETFAGRIASQTAEKIPIIGTGNMRAAAQNKRIAALESFLDGYAPPSYEVIVQSLKTQRDRIKRAAGNVLETAGARLDDAGEIPLTNTMRELSKVERELNKAGVIGSAPAAAQINELIDALTSPAKQTFSTLKENRTAFRDLINGLDGADRSQLGSRAKALADRALGAMSADMRLFARENLSPAEYRKWTRANAAYAREATKLKRTRLKNVLDKGDVTPEIAQNLLFSQKQSELNMLYSSLTTPGRAAARAAIIDGITKKLGRRASGVTPNSFASELKNLAPQINTFFRGEERKQLRGLQRVLEATKRSENASVTTPTGQSLFGLLAGAGTIANPAATIGLSGTVSGLARIYESRPVRNLLISIAETKKGTPAFRRLVAQAPNVMAAAAQSVNRRQDQEEGAE